MYSQVAGFYEFVLEFGNQEGLSLECLGGGGQRAQGRKDRTGEVGGGTGKPAGWQEEGGEVWGRYWLQPAGRLATTGAMPFVRTPQSPMAAFSCYVLYLASF